MWLYCNWIPGPMQRRSGVRKMLKFGGYITGAKFAQLLENNMDMILIGRILGADLLGLYSKAHNLYKQPIAQVRGPLIQVAIPALSAIKNDPQRYARYMYRLFEIIATVAVPISIYCLIEADFIIKLLLGPKWLAAIPVFRILAISAIVMAVANVRGLALLSLGLGSRYLTIWVIQAVGVVTSFAIGLNWSIVGVAAAYTIFCYIFFIPSLAWCFKGTPLTMKGFFKAVAPAAMTSVTCGAAIAVPKYVLGWEGGAAHIAFALGFFGMFAGMSLMRREFRDNAGAIIRQALGMSPATL